ncbi:MAG: S8 family peptidase [Flavobacteriales bacterium]
MNKISALILLVLISKIGSAQTAPGKYLIQFTDKNNSPYSLSNPSAYLSQNCIERRVKFGYGFNELDIPVNPNYVQGVLDAGFSMLHHTSKWFNSITISVVDSTVIDSIVNLPFVSGVKKLPVTSISKTVDKINKEINLNKRASLVSVSENENQYGPGFRQIEMLNGHLLHELGFTGAGMDVAIFDAGWDKVDQLPAFDALHNDGRIVMTRDFVFEDSDPVYNQSSHGMYVLSLMAGEIRDSLLGTAPDANYFLFRTENPGSEYIVEEDNWVAAAELADSLGIDVINSSLGYSLFDDTLMNHTYADMDGNTTRCTIAADIAASKGILVVNSAGNSGNSPWHYITAPSDGDSVLCVGAVNADRHRAAFSSFGPASDGDVKPNVCAMGFACVIADLDSTIRTGNGTSFSSPITAGLATCLMQAFPDRNNIEVLHAIEQSAHRYSTPSDSIGYGIPDFWKAYLILQGNSQPYTEAIYAVTYPNPCTTEMNVIVHTENPCETEYQIFNVVGQRIFEGRGFVASGEVGVLKLDTCITHLPPGEYGLHLQDRYRHGYLRFVVID